MSFEEEFDKIIRQKSEEMDFPFDEKHWAKASAMIESDKKATRLLNYKKALKPTLAFVVLTTTILILWPSGNDKKEMAVNTTSHQSERSLANGEGVNSAISNKPSVNSEKALNTEVPAFASKENNSDPKSEMPLGNTPILQTEANEKKAGTTTLEMKDSYSDSDSKKESDKNTLSNEVSHNNLSKGITGAIGAESISRAESSDPLNFTKKEEETESSQTPETDQSSFENNVMEASENLNRVDYLAAFNLSLPPVNSERSIETEKMLTILNYDDAYFKAKRKTHYLNLEAGAAYLMGWNTSAEQDGKGFDYFGGINYGFYLTNKFSLGIGVQGYNVAHMNDPFYSSSHKEYDFGSTTIYTVVTCSELFYAAVPIKLNYILNKYNSFGIGFNASYLLNAHVSTESYYYQDNAKIQTETSNEKAIYEGIEQYNYMLSAHYTHRFGKRIALNVEGTYGLTDLFKNNSVISSTEKSSGIRLSVTYTLFDN